MGQFFFIVSKENINLSNPVEKSNLFTLYLGWFGNNYNQFFDITGQVVKKDWFSYNNTNVSDS
jgi:hypothetical protein